MNDKKIDWALLILRLTFGGLMLVNHGWGKAMKLFTGDPSKFADPFGTGPEIALGLTVFAEALCAGLIVFGLFTRMATVPLIIVMLVAVFMIHWADPFGDKEMAIIYLTAFSAIFLAGPGHYSIDSWRTDKQL